MTGNRYESEVFSSALLKNVNGETGKLTEDRYEVYVNNDFVGYKTLLNMNDDLSDVDDFLRAQGIEQFKAQLQGDHYIINTDAKDQDLVRNALNVYCNNR